MFPNDGEDGNTLLRHADSALYSVKRSGKNGVRFYGGESDAKIEKRRELEKDLHTALAEDQFELYYQPIFDLKMGES